MHWLFTWCKSVGRSFFHFVTVSVFDRWTDLRLPRLRCVECSMLKPFNCYILSVFCEVFLHRLLKKAHLINLKLMTIINWMCMFCVAGLQAAFKQFGSLRIEWPGKDGKHPRYPNRGHELPGDCVSSCLCFDYCNSLQHNCWLRVV